MVIQVETETVNCYIV